MTLSPPCSAPCHRRERRHRGAGARGDDGARELELPPTYLERVGPRKDVRAVAALVREHDVEVEVAVEGFQQQRVAGALSVLPSPVWTMSFKHATRGGMALILPWVALHLSRG